MMYMPDCIKATIDLMEADAAKLRHHCDFKRRGDELLRRTAGGRDPKARSTFVCGYQPDSRQAIADSWPQTIDDAAARRSGWKPNLRLRGDDRRHARTTRCAAQGREALAGAGQSMGFADRGPRPEVLLRTDLLTGVAAARGVGRDSRRTLWTAAAIRRART